jgi:DNA-binding GntR family transcriptional regulator
MDVLGGPLRTPTKAAQAYDRLLRAILGGQIRPGDRLNIDALARELRSSTVPLREAIQKLEGQGLVVSTPHQGPRVAQLSIHEMTGIYGVREALEGLAARMAAQTISDDDVAELDRLQANALAMLDRGELDPIGALIAPFHPRIAEASRYESVREIAETTLLKVAHYDLGRLPNTAEEWRVLLDEHAAILAALRARDADAAESAARAHIRQRLEVRLRQRIDPALFVDASTYTPP